MSIKTKKLENKQNNKKTDTFAFKFPSARLSQRGEKRWSLDFF